MLLVFVGLWRYSSHVITCFRLNPCRRWKEIWLQLTLESSWSRLSSEKIRCWKRGRNFSLWSRNVQLFSLMPSINSASSTCTVTWWRGWRLQSVKWIFTRSQGLFWLWRCFVTWSRSWKLLVQRCFWCWDGVEHPPGNESWDRCEERSLRRLHQARSEAGCWWSLRQWRHKRQAEIIDGKAQSRGR